MFVDIHNHILPGIDDGAIDMDNALDMARLAAQDGTDILIATPHRSWWNRPDAPPNWVKGHVKSLQRAINTAGIRIKVLPGVEIPIGPKVADQLKSGELLTLGDAGTWALIEPPFDHIQVDAIENLQKVLDAGFNIVLAHPERNAVIQHDLGFVEKCISMGIALQLTTNSILGRFGEPAQRTAEQILQYAGKWPIVISSDSHNCEHRAPNYMSVARKAAAKIAGDDLTMEMVDTFPRSMVLKHAL